ncbi:MAG: dTDP-4-dehydrorhamnose 3,5-epimerase [Bacteroidetes bacterium]|nr:dTDP-4-dehydrorhamnose 3,5-epimerase [Bacteroidota bacterium]
MKFNAQFLAGLYTIELNVLNDERGSFARTFCKKEFAQIGHTKEFVQLNQSWNTKKGTIRGMHFQQPPFREVKLIRCVRGAVSDTVVDIRKNSPTFLEHFTVELSEENRTMIYVPEGFAHGFQTLTDNADLVYHHTEYFVPNAEGGLRYNDPLLNIKWPLPVSEISERDKNHPLIDNNYKGI